MNKARFLPKAAALSLVALGALLPAAAGANVTVQGTGEPAYTKSAGNTQWIEWNNVGLYRIQPEYYTNAVGPTVMGSYSMPSTGSGWVNWSGVPGASAPLTEGNTYAICVRGQWQDTPGGIWFPDSSTSCFDGSTRGLRTSTTIDRTSPTVGLTLAKGAEFTKSPAVAMQMDFADNLAGPFPANFLCVQYGDTSGGLCDSSKGYLYTVEPACSQPGTPGRTTKFDCTLDLAAGGSPAPDGPVSICAIAADASIPDNPSSSDQRGSAAQANLSAPACDTTLLDRTAPDLSIAATPATVNAGDTVSVNAVAADALSGLKNSYTWTWGDGAKSTGRAATHVYSAAGTYTATLKSSDTAGTAVTATKKIFVGPAGTPVPPPATAPDAGTLAITAPARVTVPATGKGTVNVTVTPSYAGRIQVTLLRGTTQVAAGGKAVAAGKSAYGLKLPAGAPAGVHTVKVAYTPTGRGPITKTVKTTLVGSAGVAPAPVAPSKPDVSSAGTHPALPDGSYHGPKGTTAVAAPTR